jgi:hypothetical protein
MRKQRVLWALAVVAVGLGVVWYASRPVAPAGQPPLVTLDADSLGTLRSDFNGAAGGTRIIVLLAPT